MAIKINSHDESDKLYFAKIKYGLEVLFINLFKAFFILIFAKFLGILEATIIIMISFAFIRHYAFGVHAKGSINCTIITSICFYIGGYIPKLLNITNYEVLIMFLVTMFLLYLYAPADTEARPLLGKKFRSKLKRKSIFYGIILIILALCINDSYIKFYISYGALCESFTITPIIYKLFDRRYRNYEFYKKSIN